MKTQNNIVKINITRVFKRTSEIVREKLIRLEGDKSLSSILNSVGWKFVVLSLGSSMKATSRIRLYHKFSTYILVMTKRHGAEFTVKYLKACNLAVSRFLAGDPVHSLRELEPDLPLPRLTKSGLPVIIGTRDRRSLHSGSHRIIRLWLTLFSLYRIILVPAKLKLNTITDPFSGNERFLEIVGNWMELKAPTIIQRFQRGVHLEKSDKFSWGEKSSPSSSKSWTGMLTDISLLKNSTKVYTSLRYLMDFTLDPKLIQTFDNLSKLVPSVSSPKFECLNFIQKDIILTLFQDWNVSFAEAFWKWKLLGLGQLQRKVEPAGKMRVFAMVDSWTQTVLLPLHVYLTKVLKNFGNDGTDSHNAAFERVMKRSLEYKKSFGYDLSAATDRLPIHIQIKLLSGLFGYEFANHWANILIGRPYYLITQKDPKTGWPTDAQAYWYKVGQPMGARSSFTMLGLTHHMIVQFASSLITNNIKWDNRYEIVGDDIIIFDEDLAKSYLNVMTLLGVPINQSKSVISRDRPVAEFVKRICHNGKDVSAFSWKQFLSQDNFLGRISTTIGLFQKEKILAEKAISIFHTVMKETIYDSRINKDSLAYLSLYFTYVIKSKMDIENMLRSLFLLGPKFAQGSLIFSDFNFHKIGNKIKTMIQTNRPPVDAEATLFSGFPFRMGKVVDINEHMAKFYMNLSINLRTKMWASIRTHQSNIINNIMGNLSFNKDKIYQDIRDELNLFIISQDKIFKNNNWIDCCEDLDLLVKHYRSLSEIQIASNLFKDLSSSFSFLTIWERVKEQPKVELFESTDPSILRDFSKVLLEIEKEKLAKKANKGIKRRPMVRPNFSHLNNIF